MSIIKEIYDVAKDGAALASKNIAIKRALKTELKLNRKFLTDIEKSENIDDIRRIEIIKMLDITEISAAVKYDIPYVSISRKKVSEELAKKYKIRRMENADFEKLIEALYLMISYLKKDHRNKKINLNLRLINIYKYNCLLLNII
jgi:hypothetical protein